MIAVARHAIRESVRRKVLLVVGILSLAFLALFWLGTREVFKEVHRTPTGIIPIDSQALTGGTLLGLAMFVTLFLGVVLAVFLTLGAVRGDAERGLLQPLVVRPLGRPAYLAGRALAAAVVCLPYVVVVFLAAVLLVRAVGGFTPGAVLVPALALAASILVVIVLSLLGSTLLGATANGIAIFMTFGAGLAAGLLGQIGEALDAHSLERASSVASWVLPFEALYEHGLHALTADVPGAAGVVIKLGPFGGAQGASGWLWPYLVVYLVAAGALAVRAFARRDL